MPNTMGLTIKIPGRERKNEDEYEDEYEDKKPLIKKPSVLSVIFNLLSRIKKCFIK